MSHRPRDSGFSLIEVLVTMSLMGILMAIAISGWSSWSKASAHTGTAREIQSVMRQAQQRAITEGAATCVQFDTVPDTYTVYRGQCSDAGKLKVTGPVSTASNVAIEEPSFAAPGGSSSSGVTFRARGTGSAGQVRITRIGSSKNITLSVDWLTGRVSLV